MRRIVLLLAVTTIFIAACGEKNNDDVTAKAPLTAPVHNDIGNPATPTSNMAAVMIPYDTGRKWVQNYWSSIDRRSGDSQVIAYSVDANALRDYLNNVETLTTLDLYLAKDGSGAMHVVYIGATAVPGSPDSDEMIYVSANDGKQYVFNHGLPCPKCDVNGIFGPVIHEEPKQ